MDSALPKQLAAMAIGREVLAHFNPQTLLREMQSDAVNVLEEIKQILDDDSLDDPECFHKIEAIVTAFHRHGLLTARHDFG